MLCRSIDWSIVASTCSRRRPDWPTEIPRRFEHVIDGDLLVEEPLEAVREGRAHPVPAIFGSTLHEAGLTAIVDDSLANARDEDIVDRLVAATAGSRPFGNTVLRLSRGLRLARDEHVGEGRLRRLGL